MHLAIAGDSGKGDANLVFHVCRHTAATRFANDVKVNTFQIDDIFGHKIERTTWRCINAKKSALLDAVGII